MIDWQRRQSIAFTWVCWLFLAGVSFWIIGKIIGPVIVFVIASLVATFLMPLVKYMRRFLPPWLAVTLVYCVVLGGIFLILYLVAGSFFAQLQALIQQVKNFFDAAATSEVYTSLGLSQEQVQELETHLLSLLQNGSLNLRQVISGVAMLSASMLLVATLSVYFLLDGERVFHWLRHKAPLSQREWVNFLLTTFDKTTRNILKGQFFLLLLMSILSGLTIWLLGMPYGTLVAVLTLFFQLIPIIGPVIIILLSGMLALPLGWGTTLLTMLLISLILGLDQFVAVVVSPRFLGQFVGLHPVVALLAMVVGSQLFGFWGALFSLPVASFVQRLVISFWRTWRAQHPEEFRRQEPSTTTDSQQP